LAQQDEAGVLAGQLQSPVALSLLGQGGRNEPGRHARSEHDRSTDGRMHGRETDAAQKAAPRRAGPATERDGVGAFRIALVEFAQGALDPHADAPLMSGHGQSQLPRIAPLKQTTAYGRELRGLGGRWGGWWNAGLGARAATWQRSSALPPVWRRGSATS